MMLTITSWSHRKFICDIWKLEYPMAHELIDAIKKGQSVVLEISPNITQLGIIVDSKYSSVIAHQFLRRSLKKM